MTAKATCLNGHEYPCEDVTEERPCPTTLCPTCGALPKWVGFTDLGGRARVRDLEVARRAERIVACEAAVRSAYPNLSVWAVGLFGMFVDRAEYTTFNLSDDAVRRLFDGDAEKARAFNERDLELLAEGLIEPVPETAAYRLSERGRKLVEGI